MAYGEIAKWATGTTEAKRQQSNGLQGLLGMLGPAMKQWGVGMLGRGSPVTALSWANSGARTGAGIRTI